jgi:hypothetical protein
LNLLLDKLGLNELYEAGKLLEVSGSFEVHIVRVLFLLVDGV